MHVFQMLIIIIIPPVITSKRKWSQTVGDYFYPFGNEVEKLYRQSPLRVRKGKTNDGRLVQVVVGSNINNWDDDQYVLENVESVSWLRPVYGGYAYCNNQVAYANYYNCGDNIFFYYSPGFVFPPTCPLDHPSYIYHGTKSTP